MTFPLKLKIVDLKTGEEDKGLTILKPSLWKTGDDVVVLSNSVKLRGTSFSGEQGFKYAYDFFNLKEKGNSVEKVMKEISKYATSRLHVMITIVANYLEFEEISL